MKRRPYPEWKKEKTYRAIRAGNASLGSMSFAIKKERIKLSGKEERRAEKAKGEKEKNSRLAVGGVVL